MLTKVRYPLQADTPGVRQESVSNLHAARPNSIRCGLAFWCVKTQGLFDLDQ
jgi:hypothetical protein